MKRTKIANAIRRHRILKKWSQEDLVKFSGIPLTTITKIEIGVIKNPSLDKVEKIAKAFGVSVEELTKKRHSAGAANIGGIKAQVWAAASMFFQYLLFNDFVKIELEAPQFEDFNLVFSNGKRLIVEVKHRNENFSVLDLIELYKKILKKAGIKEADEILIIAKKFTKDCKALIEDYSYFPSHFEKILKDNKFTDKHKKLIKKTKIWQVDFGDEEAKEIAFYMFSKLIDYGAPVDDIKRLFDSILLEKFFEGSAKGNIYSKTDLLNTIQDEKIKVVKNDGNFSLEINTLDEQLENLRLACNKVGSRKRSAVFAPNAIAAISTNPSLMSYVLAKLEMIDNLDLQLVETILNLNKNYQYSFSTGRILKKSLTSEENIDVVLRYLKDNVSALIFIRADWFWISDFTEIATQIIQFDNRYATQIVPLLEEVLKKSNTEYLYLKHESKSYELGKLVDLAVHLFDLVDENLKERLFESLMDHFSLTNRDDDYDFRDKQGLFQFVIKYFNQKYTDPKELLISLVKLIVQDYKKGFSRFSIKFKGYEVMGTTRSWHGDEYSVSDREFINELLVPLLEAFQKKDSSSFWTFIDTVMTEPVSETNPDFVRRAIIPFLVEEYYHNNYSQKQKSSDYLEILIKDTRSIPTKADLIFQRVKKEPISDEDTWALVLVSIKEFGLPQSPFIEKITRNLVDSPIKEIADEAYQQIVVWLSDDQYRKTSDSWHGDLISHFDKLIERSLDQAILLLKDIINGGQLDKIDNFYIYRFADLIRRIMKLNLDKGIELLSELLNKEELSPNEQILLMQSFHSISERETVTSEYLEQVYIKFIQPFLSKYNSIELICKRLPNAAAREVFIDIAESIIRSKAVHNKVEKALTIMQLFIKDPDPYLPGEDPDDPAAESSSHKRISEGQHSATISSVRGKLAYTLGICIFGDSREKMREIIAMTEELLEDKNYEVFNLLEHTIERLGTARLWVMPDNKDELFLSTNKRLALELAKRIEAMAFTYGERFSLMPAQAQKAMGRAVSNAFNNIRALNTDDACKLLDLIELMNPEIIHYFAPYYVYFAFYRKHQFKNWKHKMPGLYDDLSPELYDEELFFNRLISAMRKFGSKFQHELIFRLDELIKDKPKKVKEIKEIIGVLIEDFEVSKFADIYRLVDDLINSNFELAYEIYKRAITRQNNALNNYALEELAEIRQLNYYYDIDEILKLVYETKGEDEFLNAIELIFDIPAKVYIYKLNGIDDILKTLVRNEHSEKVFKLLYEKVDSRYFDLYLDWKTTN